MEAPSSRGGYGHQGGAGQQLAGQMGQMSLGGPSYAHSQGSYSPYSPSSTAPPPFASTSSPSTSSPADYANSTQTSYEGYLAANRPRPQLSPVATTGFSSGQLGGASTAGSQGGQGYAQANVGGGLPPRIPRKSSLANVPGAAAAGPSFTDSGFSEPLPPVPSASTSFSTSSYQQQPVSHPSSMASIPLSTASGGGRDSNFGGEAVFDGAALAAGTAAVPVRSTSSATEASAAGPSAAAKKANPLLDLIATETQFVEDVGVVIKRVAAAWSRSNFPPPALDSMFRAVEAVYRINKTLLAKLLEIGPNPASPRALGDLLTRWISDIEPAYTRYATTLHLGFDHFHPVQSNPNLAPILASLSYPPSLPPRANGDTSVTLDRLFELPCHRVTYYQKLYAKLLRATQEGRSDYALLIAANEKLAKLDALCKEGLTRSVLSPEERQAVEEEKRRKEEQERQEGERRLPPRLDLDLAIVNGGGYHSGAGGQAQGRSSEESGRLVDSPTSSYRSSGATGTSTANTSATNSGSPLPGSKEFTPVRVEELERRLNTERTLDIFSMQPRKCKLQMQPPSLPYIRRLRKASPVSLSFYPSCDPSRLVNHPRAFLILLTDLFLICERAVDAGPGQDLWLVYPPLAGKHLTAENGQQRGELEVTVMRKERLAFRFEDERAAAEWKNEIEETVRFGMSQAPLRSNTSSSSQGNSSPLSPSFGALGRVNGSGTSSSGHTSPLSGAFPQPLPNIQTATSSYSTSGHSGSPAPASPASNSDPYNRAFSPDGRLQPHQQVARPERKASKGPTQSPSSGNFPSSASTSSRGPSPYPSAGEYYGAQAGASYSQSSLPSNGGYSSGRQSPYGQQAPPSHQPPQQQAYYQQQQQHQPHDFGPPATSPHHGNYPTYPMPSSQSQPDFAPPNAPFAQRGYDPQRAPSRTSSRQSGGSVGSGSSVSGYPSFDGRAAPPPLPKEMSYNGMDISGRGGPLYATSLRTDPGVSGGGYDSRSMTSGRSGLLSPGGSIHRSVSADGLRGQAQAQQYRSPSQALLEDRAASAPGNSRQGSKLSHSHSGLPPHDDESPPPSPVEPKAPERTRIVAEMRCKIFLQQQHAQWKSLGTAKLKLFLSQPSNTKQLVVDSDKKGATLVSTIVLTDGVERVGKTGVAIELSDHGDRTGIIYMLQMKTEQSATGLFEQLLIGSDRVRK
ncbi:hypothetical protein JCM8547_003621 [Rhodosporidiobolus lusitaniae]